VSQPVTEKSATILSSFFLFLFFYFLFFIFSISSKLIDNWNPLLNKGKKHKKSLYINDLGVTAFL